MLRPSKAKLSQVAGTLENRHQLWLGRGHRCNRIYHHNQTLEVTNPFGIVEHGIAIAFFSNGGEVNHGHFVEVLLETVTYAAKSRILITESASRSGAAPLHTGILARKGRRFHSQTFWSVLLLRSTCKLPPVAAFVSRWKIQARRVVYRVNYSNSTWRE